MGRDVNTPRIYGLRKFAVVVLAIVAASLLVWAGKIGDGVYSTIIVAAVGGYIAGNVAQKATQKPERTE